MGNREESELSDQGKGREGLENPGIGLLLLDLPIL